MKIKEYFEYLDTFDCNISAPSKEGSKLSVPVENLRLLKGHPLIDKGKGVIIPCCYFEFESVRKSFRRVYEYHGDNDHDSEFGPIRVIEDGPFPPSRSSNFREYVFGGFLKTPPAWIEEWKVMAGGFVLVVED